MRDRRLGGTHPFWLAQHGKSMDAPRLRVGSMRGHPGAQFAESGTVLGRVQVTLGLDMTHQATVLDSCDDRVRGLPVTGFLKFEDPLVSGGIDGGQHALDGTNARDQQRPGSDQSGLKRSRLGLLRMRNARPG